jgi:hypothetical protein
MAVETKEIFMRICRFCKEHGDNLVKYEIRHYAHAKCGLKAKGAAFFDHLTDWQCTRFPALAAKDAGFLTELKVRCELYYQSEKTIATKRAYGIS